VRPLHSDRNPTVVLRKTKTDLDDVGEGDAVGANAQHSIAIRTRPLKTARSTHRKKAHAAKKAAETSPEVTHAAVAVEDEIETEIASEMKQNLPNLVDAHVLDQAAATGMRSPKRVPLEAACSMTTCSTTIA
jgi:hypothetical protein